MPRELIASVRRVDNGRVVELLAAPGGEYLLRVKGALGEVDFKVRYRGTRDLEMARAWFDVLPWAVEAGAAEWVREGKRP